MKSSYYSSILLPCLLAAFLYFFLDTHEIHGYSSSLSIQMFWLLSTLSVAMNVLGIILYGEPENTPFSGWDSSKTLRVVYVSRGNNHISLANSITKTKQILTYMEVTFIIEVITDMPLPDPKPNANYYVVPKEYITRNNSLYKARALHFLVEQRSVNDHDWLLHLDEESILTTSAIAGIAQFIKKPENKEVIGQGEIKYNSMNYGSHALITSMDAVRTGDDLGRFRLQYKLFKKPLFGMHGSFILIPSMIEAEIGFDLSGKGSITEDAYFALKAFEAGYNFSWVEGYITEQSPFNIGDIIKQRRRWFCGLFNLALDPDVKFSTRGLLLLSVTLWAISWFGPLAVIISLLINSRVFYEPLVLANCTLLAGVLITYLIGSERNLDGISYSLKKKYYIYFRTLLLIPIASLIEAVAVLYALLRPVSTFQVVNKNYIPLHN